MIFITRGEGYSFSGTIAKDSFRLRNRVVNQPVEKDHPPRRNSLAFFGKRITSKCTMHSAQKFVTRARVLTSRSIIPGRGTNKTTKEKKDIHMALNCGPRTKPSK